MESHEYRVRIKDLPPDQRPRERLREVGPNNLATVELLAILLRTGTGRVTALDLAQHILAGEEGLRFLAQATLDDLMAIEGVGLAKAAQIKAAVELGRRISMTASERMVVTNPEDVANIVMEEMRFLDREHFRVISLNTKNEVLAMDTSSIGGLNSAPVHPREVFKNPLKRSAAAIILVHNHPSGDPTPSREDIAVTRRLDEAGKILGIDLLDHLVVGDNRYVSLKERGHV